MGGGLLLQKEQNVHFCRTQVIFGEVQNHSSFLTLKLVDLLGLLSCENNI